MSSFHSLSGPKTAPMWSRTTDILHCPSCNLWRAYEPTHTNPEAPYKQATPATPATALHGSKAGVALPPWQSCKQLHGREPWEGCWKLPCLLPAFWSNSLICFLILLIRCFMCLTCVDPHSHMDGPLLADWHQAWIRTKAKQGAKLRMHKCTWSYIRKPVIHTHGSLCSPATAASRTTSRSHTARSSAGGSTDSSGDTSSACG